MNITITLKAKICLWYKLLMKLFSLLLKSRMVKVETAARILCGLSGKGCKFKIGKGRWQRLNCNVGYEIIEA